MSDKELLDVMTWRKEVEYAKAEGGEAAGAASSKPPSGAAKVSGQEVLELADAKAERCGAKAAACAQLLKLAEESRGSFMAPGGAVIPFGVMDLAVEASGQKAGDPTNHHHPLLHPSSRHNHAILVH
jgi:hypothetical protein